MPVVSFVSSAKFTAALANLHRRTKTQAHQTTIRLEDGALFVHSEQRQSGPIAKFNFLTEEFDLIGYRDSPAPDPSPA